jgi:hypothetical protein
MRVRLQQQRRTREPALLNLGVESKLRPCDPVASKVRDIAHREHVASRAIVHQKKTGRPVQFGITAPVREATQARIKELDCAAKVAIVETTVPTVPQTGR